jgi:hypothetical protein
MKKTTGKTPGGRRAQPAITRAQITTVAALGLAALVVISGLYWFGIAKPRRDFRQNNEEVTYKRDLLTGHVDDVPDLFTPELKEKYQQGAGKKINFDYTAGTTVVGHEEVLVPAYGRAEQEFNRDRRHKVGELEKDFRQKLVAFQKNEFRRTWNVKFLVDDTAGINAAFANQVKKKYGEVMQQMEMKERLLKGDGVVLAFYTITGHRYGITAKRPRIVVSQGSPSEVVEQRLKEADTALHETLVQGPGESNSSITSALERALAEDTDIPLRRAVIFSDGVENDGEISFYPQNPAPEFKAKEWPKLAERLTAKYGAMPELGNVVIDWHVPVLTDADDNTISQSLQFWAYLFTQKHATVRTD